MIGQIFGIFWILIGLLWLIKPHWLRSRMGRKTTRKIRWPIYIFLFFLGLNLLGLAIRFDGLLAKIAAVIGVVLILKFLLSLQTRAMGKFLDWWSNLPLYIFRIMAGMSIVTGLALIYAS